jgi:replicative DNA helicase
MTAKAKPMRYGMPFQRSVLKLMMMDHLFCQRACEYLQAGHFTGELSWFFTQIKEYFQSHSQMATKETLSADIAKHTTVEKQLKYDAELTEIFATQPAVRKIKSEMTSFIRANRFVEAAKKAVGMYNDVSKQDESYTYIYNRLQEIIKVDFEEDRYSRFGNAQAILEKARLERVNAIPTGIYKIDEAMGGGMMPGTWTTFLGASNAGKSMLMPNLAYHAVMSGKRVFITVHEDEENPTMLRYLSRFSEIPYNTLAYGYHTLTPEQQTKVAAADALLNKSVVIRFMYTTESTIENVMDTCRALMKEWPFDLYLCDYGQCLTSSAFRAVSEIRHLNEHVYHNLKQLCLELKIAGAGGAQVNRNGMTMNRSGAQLLRMTDVAEAIGITKKSSNIITLNRSEEMKKNNQVIFLLDKVRNGRCPVSVRCESNYEMCMTHSDDPLSQAEIFDLDEAPNTISGKAKETKGAGDSGSKASHG